MPDVPGFPFTPSSARQVRDPAAEAERLAGARKAAETVTVSRGDFAVLVALARRGAGELAGLPDGVTMGEAVRLLERYAAL